MIHKSTIEKYDGSLEELAEDIGDLRYDALADFLNLLSQKIQKDGKTDVGRNRKKLAKRLFNTAENLKNAKEGIETAWVICKPFMKNYD